MKKFVSNLFLFLLLFLVLTVLSIFVVNRHINNKASFKVKNGVKYIVFGPSNPECAVNDSLIDNFQNFAQSGEAYLYTYVKAKKLLPQNPQVEAVFIEYNISLINNKIEEWIWGDKISYRYSTYFPFMDAAEQNLILKNNCSGFLNKVAVATKFNFSAALFNEMDYSQKIGAYVYLRRDKTDSLVANLPKTPQAKMTRNELAHTNIHYLIQLIDLCKKYNKTVYLMRCPVHSKYPELVNEAMVKQIRIENFPDIPFLDFAKFPLLNSDCGDFEHLNYRGAKKFSTWLNGLMHDSLLLQENKQAFINTHIEALQKPKE